MADKWKQKDFAASSDCLLNVHCREDCEKFAEQWFEKVEHVEDHFHRDYFVAWFGNLSPYFLGRKQDLERMRELLQKYEDTDKTLFVKLLKEEIDALEDVIAMQKF